MLFKLSYNKEYNTKIMTEAEKIILASAVGLAIWGIQKLIMYLILKKRITQSLLTDIDQNLFQVNEVKSYLIKYNNQSLKVGEKLTYIDQFMEKESTFFHSQLNDLPKYFSRSELKKITKFYYSFWELQALIVSYVSYLVHLHEKGEKLVENEIDKAKGKIERIIALMDIILKKKIEKISNLPINYEGRVSPGHDI